MSSTGPNPTRVFAVHPEATVADPSHLVIVSERKKNGDWVEYENFDALEELIAGVKYAKAYDAGFNDGKREQHNESSQLDAYKYATGYEEGFDRGVHLVLETLGITDAEFSLVEERERLKKTVIFYRGLANLGMDINRLEFFEEQPVDEIQEP